jgi:hypothetical protein
MGVRPRAPGGQGYDLIRQQIDREEPGNVFSTVFLPHSQEQTLRQPTFMRTIAVGGGHA